ncbi:transcriptional regulator [Staphylococcus caledonicus]|uniref:transcriptional regulator n=1 Tax=Staphylococcus caledonicus TaxID=2741333 RepID=UPI003C2FDB02
MRLSKITINYLESELIHYKQIYRDIEHIRSGKLYPSQYNKQKAIKDRRLKQLTRIKPAIEHVYDTSIEDSQRLIDRYYFYNVERLNLTGIALKLNVSKSTAYNLRNYILLRLADELGIIH